MRTINSDKIRNTGITTRQIIHAPALALYVCVNEDHLKYCKNIAQKHDRGDILFISAGRIKPRIFSGLNRFVEIDHAVKMEKWVLDMIRYFNTTRHRKSSKNARYL